MKQLLFQTQISTIGQFINLGEISVPKRLIKQPVNSINTETVTSINTETVNSINTETSYQGNHLVKNNPVYASILFFLLWLLLFITARI